MKIIDALWEKRNLSTDVIEIVCEDDDTVEMLNETLKTIKVPYAVCKVPNNRSDLLLCAQKNNFSVIEMSIRLEAKTNDLELPRIYNRFMKDVTIKEADEHEIEYVLKKIEDGKIFTTDRISYRFWRQRDSLPHPPPPRCRGASEHPGQTGIPQIPAAPLPGPERGP